MPPDDTRTHANSAPERDERGRWLRPNANSWQPGQHGGGRGRPSRERELAEEARKLVPETLRMLAQVLRDKKAQAIARVRAGEVILERAFGKAPARLILETDYENMSNPMLRAFLLERIREMQVTIEAGADTPVTTLEQADSPDADPELRAIAHTLADESEPEVEG